MTVEDAFSALSGLAAFADTDLVCCSRRGKLVYKTAGFPDRVRETLASYRELLLSLFPPGSEECREVRELLTDPRRLASLFWSAGDWEGGTVLTWVVDGVYERTILPESEVARRIWEIPRNTTRVHLAGSDYAVDVERSELQELLGVYAVTGHITYTLLVNAARANAFVEALKAVSFPRDLRVYKFNSGGLY